RALDAISHVEHHSARAARPVRRHELLDPREKGLVALAQHRLVTTIAQCRQDVLHGPGAVALGRWLTEPTDDTRVVIVPYNGDAHGDARSRTCWFALGTRDSIVSRSSLRSPGVRSERISSLEQPKRQVLVDHDDAAGLEKQHLGKAQEELEQTG